MARKYTIAPIFDQETRYRNNILSRLELKLTNLPQINTSFLLLEYLVERDITSVLDILRKNSNKSLYLDDTAKEIYDLYYNDIFDVKNIGKILNIRGEEREVFSPIDRTFGITQSRIDIIEYKIRTFARQNYEPNVNSYLERVSISNKSELLGKRKIESTNRDRRILFRITQAERNIKNRNLRKKYPSIERDTIKR